MILKWLTLAYNYWLDDSWLPESALSVSSLSVLSEFSCDSALSVIVSFSTLSLWACSSEEASSDVCKDSPNSDLACLLSSRRAFNFPTKSSFLDSKASKQESSWSRVESRAAYSVKQRVHNKIYILGSIELGSLFISERNEISNVWLF